MFRRILKVWLLQRNLVTSFVILPFTFSKNSLFSQSEVGVWPQKD